MSAYSGLNDEQNIVLNKEIYEFLTPEICEDAGIIIIDLTDNKINLGAMNLNYIKVKKS